MTRYGERLPLGVNANGKVACSHSGDVYVVRNGSCTLEPAALSLP